jgi:predicted phage terminase large subunit-like protein
MIKEAWFKRYGTDELPAKFDQVVQSWDTANKPTELSDYSVCTTWGLKNNLVYLVHVLRKRLEYPDLKRAVRDQASTHKATVILIEDRASGTQLIQELKAERVSGITPYVPEGDKVMRMNAQTAAIENGLVYVPKEAHWLTDYLHELTTFPSGKYDDQADSTSQALAWIQQSSRQPGLLVFYQEELQRQAQQRGANGTRVDLKAPPGDSTSTVYTMTGHAINVGPDRVIRQLSQEDARPLIARGWQPIQ